MLLSNQGAGVGRVRGVLLQEARQAEVRHLAHQVAVDQNVTGSQVSVDVAHLGQVLHARGDATQHTHQLDGSELAVVELNRREKKLSWRMSDMTASHVTCSLCHADP